MLLARVISLRRAGHPGAHGRRHRHDPPLGLSADFPDHVADQGVRTMSTRSRHGNRARLCGGGGGRRACARRAARPAVRGRGLFPRGRGPLPVHPGRVDAPLRLHPGAPHREGADDRLRRSDRRRPARRARAAHRPAAAPQGRQPRGDHEHPPEERVLPARPRRGHRGFPHAARLEDEEGEETLTIDRITQDASPIIKLVDSILFNAIQRRASDIHIETQENVVLIKYRIDGVLYQAMDPDRQAPPRHDHFPHQGHVGAGHRREADPPGRPLQAARARPDDRLPRLDHADGARRGRRHPHPGQGVGQRGVQEPEPRRARLRRRDEEEAAQVHP